MKKAIFLPIFLMIGLMSNAWGGDRCGYSGSSEYRVYWRDDYDVDFVQYDCDNSNESDAQGVTACSGDVCTGVSLSMTSQYNICIPSGIYVTFPGERGTQIVRVSYGNRIGVCKQTKVGAQRAEVSAAAQKKCEDSHGKWENNQCTCDASKGLSHKNSDAKECTCGNLNTWDPGQEKCVENSDEVGCRLSGGNWNGTECTCTETGLRQKEPYRKVCECTAGPNYTWQNGQCRNSHGRTQTEQANAESWDRQTQSANRSTCEASGGTYSRRKCSCTAENTQVVSGKCECNSGYKWINENNKRDGCEPTDSTLVSQACSAAATKGQAQWQRYPSPGQCICNESGYVLDVNVGECKPIQERAACDVLTQQNKARWNTAQKKCICSQTGYEFDGNTCVETAEGAATRKANELATAKAKIENVHSKLKKTQDGFKVSAWKNEEGNFNTARLASDSIAGVVVGTAGGLLTSKIVKKNQVEDGFEDIQCTIGGQTVAGWGDEFSVGNQM